MVDEFPIRKVSARAIIESGSDEVSELMTECILKGYLKVDINDIPELWAGKQSELLTVARAMATCKYLMFDRSMSEINTLIPAIDSLFGDSIDGIAFAAVVIHEADLTDSLRFMSSPSNYGSAEELGKIKKSYGNADWKKYIGVTMIARSLPRSKATDHHLSRWHKAADNISTISRLWDEYDSETVEAVGELLLTGLSVDDALVAFEHGIDPEFMKAAM